MGWVEWDGGVSMDGREQKVGGGRRPKKKPLRGKKVGFAEKKLRLWLKMAHRVYQGEHVPTCGGLPKPTLSKAHCFGYGFLQAALGCASLAWSCPRYAISMASLPLAAI